MRQIAIAMIFATLASGAAAQSDAPVPQGAPNVPEFSPAFPEQTRAPAIQSTTPEVAVFASGLEHPWGIAELPGGGLLVTERPGRMRHVSADGTLSAPISGLPAIWAGGQGGLLDIAIGPTFADDRLIYWTYAKPMPDNREATSAQDLSKTIGKVIRVTLDGNAPHDNPFADKPAPQPEIYSYGHRNMQGATIGPGGALWTIEHGPRGGDELNRPQPGANYGWPLVSYGEDYSGQPIGDGQTSADAVIEPAYYWDPVIAPGGMAFYSGDMFPDWQGDLLIGSLNPGALVRLRLSDGKVTGEERILPGIARIRDVEVMADGAILLAVDAPDGGLLRLSR
ncbi:MAG: PQQ-dependent sugar dehydrogenase [Rhodobacteraceae bacterium]|nr:PQQ-dependent sugar dehydrogenase [Paracoccaceae bacterium]